jgi:hypothetical protein
LLSLSLPFLPHVSWICRSCFDFADS